MMLRTGQLAVDDLRLPAVTDGSVGAEVYLQYCRSGTVRGDKPVNAMA